MNTDLPDDAAVLVGDRVALELPLLGGQLDVVDSDGAVVQPHHHKVRVLRVEVQTHHTRLCGVDVLRVRRVLQSEQAEVALGHLSHEVNCNMRAASYL